MKVLFSHGYYYRLDKKQWKQGTPFPPLGTLYAAACVREMGHDVHLFDVGLLDGPQTIAPSLALGPDVLVIYDDGFNYLTKMCLTDMRHATFEMISLAKTQSIPVLVCSSDSTDHYVQYLQQGADAVLIGEGEQSLQEVLDAFTDRQAWKEIEGIAFMDGEEVVVSPKRKVMRNLDELPLPAWDLADVNAYREIWKKSGHAFQLNIATTRGCPYQCNWCAKPIYGQRYNVRSPERVVEEIAYLKAQFQTGNFWMCDDIFGLKPGWVQSFDQALKKQSLAITYKIQSRADLLLKTNNIEALVSSGLQEAWIGAESGSQKILDAMDKGTTVEQIGQATQLLQAHGVKVGYFLQFGYLGEQESDIQATFQMLKNNRPDFIGVSVSYPLPGTPFFEKVKNQLGSKANWTDSDDLALMFQNTFNQAYYKVLHRLVHKEFRWHQISAGFQSNFSGTMHWKTVLKWGIYPVLIWGYRRKLHRMKNIAAHE